MPSWRTLNLDRESSPSFSGGDVRAGAGGDPSSLSGNPGAEGGQPRPGSPPFLQLASGSQRPTLRLTKLKLGFRPSQRFCKSSEVPVIILH